MSRRRATDRHRRHRRAVSLVSDLAHVHRWSAPPTAPALQRTAREISSASRSDSDTEPTRSDIANERGY